MFKSLPPKSLRALARLIMDFALFQSFQGDLEQVDKIEKCVEFVSFLTRAKYTAVFECPHR
jgi:hypothetical protein